MPSLSILEKKIKLSRIDLYPFLSKERGPEWHDTFENSHEGRDMMPLIDRPRLPGVLPVEFGTTREKKRIVVDLARKHSIVTGTTTFGKTNFLRSLLIQLMHFNDPKFLKIVTMDAKKVGFVSAQNVINVMGGYEKTCETLALLGQELERRSDLFAEKKWSWLRNAWQRKSRKLPPPFILAILDEYGVFVDKSNETKEEGKKMKNIVQAIAGMGASLGISLILSTQIPLKEFLPTTFRGNFDCRLTFKLPERQQYRSFIGEGYSSVSQNMKKGDFVMTHRGGLERARAPLCEDVVFARGCRNIGDNLKDFRLF